ncbi:hypothetical protein A0H81_07108 [Grifola frondosa]|uniref:Uncharacterized protein n=1 Tax=Grifola frondosa TaxID=5627 RepID=A0A1C7M861_GRIFR|nr:hypothetical protein A0H81_07108 [Grifola frondosa]
MPNVSSDNSQISQPKTIPSGRCGLGRPESTAGALYSLGVMSSAQAVILAFRLQDRVSNSRPTSNKIVSTIPDIRMH